MLRVLNDQPSNLENSSGRVLAGCDEWGEWDDWDDWDESSGTGDERAS